MDGWNGDQDGLVGTLEARPLVCALPSVCHQDDQDLNPRQIKNRYHRSHGNIKSPQLNQMRTLGGQESSKTAEAADY